MRLGGDRSQKRNGWNLGKAGHIKLFIRIRGMVENNAKK